jgi:hypothetical protein
VRSFIFSALIMSYPSQNHIDETPVLGSDNREFMQSPDQRLRAIIMKLLFGFWLLFAASAVNLSAQTNTATTPAATPVDAVKAEPTPTNQTAKTTEPYPVTAIIVSNTITFPTLLSKSGTELMTNAVFRRSFGRKVIFAQEFNLRSFDVDQLHPSVIAQLNLDPDKLKTDQSDLDQKNKDWAIQNQQKNQQILAAEAAALSKSQAAQQAAQSAAPNNSDPSAPATVKKHRGKPPTAPAN